MTTIKPREMLESLCDGIDEYWRRDDDGQLVVNIYKLHDDLVEWAKEKSERKPIAQSTLNRLYNNESETFSPQTANTLSDFCKVPAAVIKGDLTLDSLESWGMDIKHSEIRMILMIRELSPAQRRAIYDSIVSMLPPGTDFANLRRGFLPSPPPQTPKKPTN